MASCSWRTYPGWLQRSKKVYVSCVSITAGDFIVKKDAQAVIPNDGKQTPTKGARGLVNLGFALTGAGAETLVPLGIAIFGGNKFFCNYLCGRGQLFSKLGGDLKCSRNKPTPRWMSSKWFRYGFLIFFLTMFGNMVFQTYLVGAGSSSLREAIKLFWTFRVPWGWTYTAGTVADWVAQFSFGFYSLMLTSLLLGLIVMVLYKPRTWCTFCPMGTMTQGICKLKNNEKK